MTITGALMFGAPALVSASEGIASTDTENSAADNAAAVSYTHLDVYKRQGQLYPCI